MTTGKLSWAIGRAVERAMMLGARFIIYKARGADDYAVRDAAAAPPHELERFGEVYQQPDGTFTVHFYNAGAPAPAIEHTRALRPALASLTAAATLIEAKHHAGNPIDSEFWASLFHACNSATAVLKATEPKDSAS